MTKYQIDNFRIYHKTGLKGLYYAEVHLKGKCKTYEIETTEDGDVLIADCNDEAVCDVIRAAVNLIL